MESEFGSTWEDPGGGFINFAIQRALKQDQTLHMEGKLQFILYFSTECVHIHTLYNHTQKHKKRK